MALPFALILETALRNRFRPVLDFKSERGDHVADFANRRVLKREE
jgi:hypothetical protein